ncbi:MAG TPA: hypothetical protein VFG64_19365 [Dongiaceae bacterium]|nr:hypothetical protein [Dongiaceae bacterium]
MPISLRDLIQKDFGVDLPIAGGYGASADDPILIMTEDPACAARTQMQVLRCIGRGREILWRRLSCTRLDRKDRSLDQVAIETKAIDPQRVTTTRANYYFDVTAADSANNGLPAAPGFLDQTSGIELPFEIGWLHFESVLENKPDIAGHGCVIAHVALGIKATVYIYLPENPQARRLDELAAIEFDAAVGDVVTMNPQLDPVSGPRVTGRFLRQDFRSRDERSVLALAVANDRLVKVRMTSNAQPEFIEAAEDSLEVLIRDIRRAIDR